jgi:glucuronoxylan 4-O-methyltransferase
VVSTPSKGGRDVFFDPDYCIVCEPHPLAVREAVAALRARRIPAADVRARTLARVEPERERLLTMVDELIEGLGGTRCYGGGGWPFGDTSGVRWGSFKKHLAELAEQRRRAGLGEKLAIGAVAIAERQRAELAEKIGLGADVLADVQLEAQELDPIIAAIRKRPGCALLVFGCGRDSFFWERVNRGGTTAFLEDNPEWAADARAKLATATVHVVEYGTRVSEWRRLLDDPSARAMDLPAEIGSRRWDVILVDGPAGYDDKQPGRMKSIDAASCLVAPGGCVFVHDCERPVEQAFTSRCLGDDRVFLEVKGKALLRGYAF